MSTHKKLLLIVLCLALMVSYAYADNYTKRTVGNSDYVSGDNGYSGTGRRVGNTYYYDDNAGQTQPMSNTNANTAMNNPNVNVNWNTLNRINDESHVRNQAQLESNLEQQRLQQQNNAQLKQEIVKGIVEGKITEEQGKKLYEDSTGEKWQVENKPKTKGIIDTHAFTGVVLI